MSDSHNASTQPDKELLKRPIIKETYATVFRNLPLCFAIIVILALVDIGTLALIDLFTQFIGTTLPAEASKEEILHIMTITGAISFFSIIVIILPINIAFYVGTQKIFLKKMTEGKTSIKYLFSAFKRFISIIGATLLLYGMLMLLIIGSAALVSLTSMLQIGALVFLGGVIAIGFVFYLFIRFIAFHFFGLIIVIEGKKAITALKRSYQKASPYVYDIFFSSILLLITLVPILALLTYLEVDILRQHSVMMQEGLKTNSLVSLGSTEMKILDFAKYFIREILLLLVTVMHTIFYRKIFIDDQ